MRYLTLLLLAVAAFSLWSACLKTNDPVADPPPVTDPDTIGTAGPPPTIWDTLLADHPGACIRHTFFFDAGSGEYQHDRDTFTNSVLTIAESDTAHFTVKGCGPNEWKVAYADYHSGDTILYLDPSQQSFIHFNLRVIKTRQSHTNSAPVINGYDYTGSYTF